MESGSFNAKELLEQLDKLETQVEKISVPLSYAEELYALRNHIQLVRKRVTYRSSQNTAAPPDAAAATAAPDSV